MNDKIAKVKNKLKKHATEIILFTSTAAVAVYAFNEVRKQFTATGSGVFEPLPMVDRDTQKTLMEDDAFGLYKLTDDEYMFARIIAD